MVVYSMCSFFNTQCALCYVHCKRNIILTNGVYTIGTPNVPKKLGFNSWLAQDILLRVILAPQNNVEYYLET